MPPAAPPRILAPGSSLALVGLLAPFLAALAACGSDAGPAGRWAGTVDTLASGEIAVRNPAEPLWTPAETWQVVEELRIGEALSEGPKAFGSVCCFAVDAGGRIYILDSQAQEVRVFDAAGGFVRTFGRRGEGPGEFTGAASIDVAPGGEVWVMDQRLLRVSKFDTAGAFLEQRRMPGSGGSIRPYPGGLDPLGRFNVALVPRDGPRALARFDESLEPLDTITIPEDPTEREFFEYEDETGSMRLRAGVPLQGYMTWRFSPGGGFWTLVTDRYELAELTTDGAVLRRITRIHEPIPVTEEDVEAAVERLEWFTSQGGRIDRSRLPRSKPSAVGFFVDDESNLWVEQEVAAADEAEAGRRFDVFDGDGRYLGALRLPFSLETDPEPIVRDAVLYGLTYDEIGVSYAVRARIVKP